MKNEKITIKARVPSERTVLSVDLTTEEYRKLAEAACGKEIDPSLKALLLRHFGTKHEWQIPARWMRLSASKGKNGERSFEVKHNLIYRDGEFKLDDIECKIMENADNPAKLYFKYGVMGSSKTIQALVTRYNYEERGIATWLIKPAIDTRDDKKNGETVIRSRIGLEANATAISPDENIMTTWLWLGFSPKVIIADEAQFFTYNQIKQLRQLASQYGITVLCYGLRTAYTGELFEGSMALFALADSISEVKAMCDCGNKAIMNGRFLEDSDKYFTLKGPKVLLGGNERYKGVCHKCWSEMIFWTEGENLWAL